MHVQDIAFPSNVMFSGTPCPRFLGLAQTVGASRLNMLHVENRLALRLSSDLRVLISTSVGSRVPGGNKTVSQPVLVNRNIAQAGESYHLCKECHPQIKHPKILSKPTSLPLGLICLFDFLFSTWLSAKPVEQQCSS